MSNAINRQELDDYTEQLKKWQGMLRDFQPVAEQYEKDALAYNKRLEQAQGLESDYNAKVAAYNKLAEDYNAKMEPIKSGAERTLVESNGGLVWVTGDGSGGFKPTETGKRGSPYIHSIQEEALPIDGYLGGVPNPGAISFMRQADGTVVGGYVNEQQTSEINPAYEEFFRTNSVMRDDAGRIVTNEYGQMMSPDGAALPNAPPQYITKKTWTQVGAPVTMLKPPDQGMIGAAPDLSFVGQAPAQPAPPDEKYKPAAPSLTLQQQRDLMKSDQPLVDAATASEDGTVASKYAGFGKSDQGLIARALSGFK